MTILVPHNAPLACFTILFDPIGDKSRTVLFDPNIPDIEVPSIDCGDSGSYLWFHFDAQFFFIIVAKVIVDDRGKVHLSCCEGESSPVLLC